MDSIITTLILCISYLNKNRILYKKRPSITKYYKLLMPSSLEVTHWESARHGLNGLGHLTISMHPFLSVGFQNPLNSIQHCRLERINGAGNGKMIKY